MNPAQLKRINDYEWQLPQTGAMRVPAVIFADRAPSDSEASVWLADLELVPDGDLVTCESNGH